jgi:hypothetical protein
LLLTPFSNEHVYAIYFDTQLPCELEWSKDIVNSVAFGQHVTFKQHDVRIGVLTHVMQYRLVQWCHGAPGMLMTLSSLHTIFGSVFPYEFERLMPLCDLPSVQQPDMFKTVLF